MAYPVIPACFPKTCLRQRRSTAQSTFEILANAPVNDSVYDRIGLQTGALAASTGRALTR